MLYPPGCLSISYMFSTENSSVKVLELMNEHTVRQIDAYVFTEF